MIIVGSVEELQHKVQQLNREQLAAFRTWFHQFDAEEWDRQIERDARAGKLDTVANKAVAEHKAGSTSEL